MSRELPHAVNGWRLEASRLSKSRSWNFYRTFDHVLVRYLAAGDARPLLDLIVNLSRPPGRRACEFIAAITDGKALIDRIGDSPTSHQSTCAAGSVIAPLCTRYASVSDGGEAAQKPKPKRWTQRRGKVAFAYYLGFAHWPRGNSLQSNSGAVSPRRCPSTRKCASTILFPSKPSSFEPMDGLGAPAIQS